MKTIKIYGTILQSLFYRELSRILYLSFNGYLLIIKFLNAGNVLLSRALRQSTIGAEGLDFRVRNGIGYNPFAIITGNSLLAILLHL